MGREPSPGSVRTSAVPRRPRLGRTAGIAIVFGLLASGAVAVISDWGETIDAVTRFDVRWLGLAVLIAFASHIPKAIRWHIYTVQVTRSHERVPSLLESLAVYQTGVTMLLTPGMIGEWYKSYQLHALGGATPARTAPIVIAERVTNMIGLVLLAAAGLAVYRTAFWAVFVSALLAAALIVVTTSPRAARLATLVIERIPVVRRFVPHADEFTRAAASVMGWRSVIPMSVLAYLSWVVEALAYVAVLRGLGVEPTWTLLYQAGFIWAVTTLAGGLFLTPGGLGVQEGGLVGLGAALIPAIDVGEAAAAAIITRFATLWIPAALGVVAITWLARRTRQETRPVSPPASLPSSSSPAPNEGSSANVP